MPRNPPFFRLGKFIFRHCRAILGMWIVLILCCLPFIPQLMTPFKSTGFVDDSSASVAADNYLNKEFNYNKERILISYHHKTLLATNPKFTRELKASLADLKDFPVKHEIFYPEANSTQLSKDKHTAIVEIAFTTDEPLSHESLEKLQRLIKNPPDMTMLLGGEPIFIEGVNKQTQKDLFNADIIAVPVSIIILLIVFGSMVAALLPLLLGGGCALLILTTLFF